MMNTLIRVLPVTLIWVLGHTPVWVSSNNLYVVYHRLVVLMLYILLFIAAVTRHMCTTFVVLFILTTPNLELYREWNSLIHNSHLLCGNIYNPFRI